MMPVHTVSHVILGYKLDYDMVKKLFDSGVTDFSPEIFDSSSKYTTERYDNAFHGFEIVVHGGYDGCGQYDNDDKKVLYIAICYGVISDEDWDRPVFENLKDLDDKRKTIEAHLKQMGLQKYKFGLFHEVRMDW